MSAALIVVATVIGMAILLASAMWADGRYRGYDRLPMHFDWRGKADGFGPRKVIVWLVPGIFAVTLAAIAAMLIWVPREMQNGDPSVGIVVATLAMIGGQAFTLWLLERWVRENPPT
jgi:hypothetical protein